MNKPRRPQRPRRRRAKPPDPLDVEVGELLFKLLERFFRPRGVRPLELPHIAQDAPAPELESPPPSPPVLRLVRGGKP